MAAVEETEQGQMDEKDEVEFDIHVGTEKKTRGKPKVVKKKGRGFRGVGDNREERYGGKGGDFDALEEDEDDASVPAQKSVEGWIVICRGVHEEAQESDLYDLFADFGEIKQLILNLDRRTGFVKGYCLVEYGTLKEAQKAIDELNNTTLLDEEIEVDWAFKKAPRAAARGRRERRRR